VRQIPCPRTRRWPLITSGRAVGSSMQSFGTPPEWRSLAMTTCS
jgi:hypothetical protein